MSKGNNTVVKAALEAGLVLTAAGCGAPHTKPNDPAALAHAVAEYAPGAGGEAPNQVGTAIFRHPESIGTQIESQKYTVLREAQKDAGGALTSSKKGFCAENSDKATLGADRLDRHAITRGSEETWNRNTGTLGLGEGASLQQQARKTDLGKMDGIYREELKRIRAENCAPTAKNPVTGVARPASPAGGKTLSSPGFGNIHIHVNGENNDPTVVVTPPGAATQVQRLEQGRNKASSITVIPR